MGDAHVGGAKARRSNRDVLREADVGGVARENRSGRGARKPLDQRIAGVHQILPPEVVAQAQGAERSGSNSFA